MADDSTQKWIGRNRPPRVQITYDLETGGADTKKELPLVVGILADLAGPDASKDPEALATLKKRKFIEIDRDNFNDVLKSIGPTLRVRGVELKFAKLDDFRPESIVQQVPALKRLLGARQNLNDLLAKLDGNDSLNAELSAVVENTEKQLKLREALPAAADDGGAAAGSADAAKPAEAGTDKKEKKQKGKEG
jgi:type VI secretion system protein ImpB